ncbi:Protein regulator of cytokinesis 1 [Portunus trituberculatus]|uniref:Protein regulator of cytokinesis 1 n=1 Tax=Portunus trituberculatus TaxID=210409 RepID=A0A5B7DCR0_PORTR|nr:Protein regulator of cytokinesis 1 [Portunus trituberculatus]
MKTTIEEINEVVHEAATKLNSIWSECGFSEEMCRHRRHKMVDHVKALMSQMIDGEKNLRKTLVKSIDDNGSKFYHLNKELGADIPDPEENLSLIELERYLRRAVAGMEKEVKERQNALEELRSQEKVSEERDQLPIGACDEFHYDGSSNVGVTKELARPGAKQAFHDIISTHLFYYFALKFLPVEYITSTFHNIDNCFTYICVILTGKFSQELCECLKEKLSDFEKKAIPSKESIKDLERIVKTLEQEKVCVKTCLLVSCSFFRSYDSCFEIRVVSSHGKFASLAY